MVFTDIMMPGVDGFSMVNQMRELPGYGGTPVVYVTALGDYQTRVTSVLSGGCDLIVKPFNPSEMAVKTLTIGLQESVERWENDRRTTPVAPSTSPTDNPGDLVCRLEKRCATLETRLHELTAELKEVSSALKTANSLATPTGPLLSRLRNRHVLRPVRRVSAWREEGDKSPGV